ncbi:hypothetical protein DL546_002920 [Coniochaeta pulveracea]|uniref:SCP domain-containing protein n=1 Tax=Coniochaeta pulveracea TaxID=177199 RepID=A0A420YGW6_9PEZI|nr:hypothetical protein DL546_002920 [Coniochaeta pulveracea]
MYLPSLSSVFTTGLLLVSSISSVSAGATRYMSGDQQAALEAHNKGRATKNLSALQWDVSLANSAQTCADKIASTGNFAHCQSGENLYAQSGGSGNLYVNGVTAWLNEAPQYHNEKIPNGNFAGYGHYTQVMWKSTTRVGMAMAKGSNGWTYIVAHYNPAGNVVGQTPY